MKKFLTGNMYFGLLIGLILYIGLFLPNYQVEDSLDFALIDKHKLMDESESPKLIFVGGSNLSFGMNSKLIRDSLNMNVINTGIHASYGLKFIMNDVIDHIEKDDIVILSPEYHQFYGTLAEGEEALLKVLFDVYPDKYKTLPVSQWFYLLKYIPRYVGRKLLGNVLYLIAPNSKKLVNSEDYMRDSFNEYGDVTTHWNKPQYDFPPDNESPVCSMPQTCYKPCN
ncbi:hypothetical protein ACFL6I_24065, partial [candidate division KSB1 bacterium]